VVVDDSSTVKEAPDYYPFGLELPGRTYLSGTGAKEGFTGKERDTETGLDYFGARYYMAALGRWGNVDPLAEHPAQIDKSLYAYAWNNPTNLTDPDGRFPMCVAPAIPWLVTAVEAAIYTAATVGAAYIGAEILHEVIDGVQMDPGMPSISSADIDAPLVSAPDATGVAIPNITSLDPPVIDGLSTVTATALTRDQIKEINGMPGDARLTRNEDVVFQNLHKNHGIDAKTASTRLHQLKKGAGLAGSDKLTGGVVFDLTGNIYHLLTGEVIGSLTEGGTDRKERNR